MPGLINLDFADVKAIMHDAGSALMGIGRASGENRAVEAAKQAIASPLLEINITGAQGILFNITGSSNLTLYEVTEAAEEIRAAADPEANIIFGTSFDERLGDEVVITVIATGFDANRKRDVGPPRERRVAVRGRPGRPRPGARLPRRAGEQPPRGRRRRRAPDARDRARRAPPAPSRRPQRTVAAEPAAGDRPARRPYDEDDLEIPSFLRRK